MDEKLKSARDALRLSRPIVSAMAHLDRNEFGSETVHTANVLVAIDQALAALAQPPEAPAAVEVSRLAEEAKLIAQECADAAHHGDSEFEPMGRLHAAIDHLASQAFTASEPAARDHLCSDSRDCPICQNWQPAARLVGGEAADSQWQIVRETLSDFRLVDWVDADGEQLPLTDHLCHKGDTSIERGTRALNMLCDDIMAALAATQPPRAASGATGEAVDAFWNGTLSDRNKL